MKKSKTSSPMRSYPSSHYLVDSSLIRIREEVDEETQEWEQAQIKRSGLKPDEDSSHAAIPVYKPAPSTRLAVPVFGAHSHTPLVPSLTEIPSLESSVMHISHIMTSIAASHAQNTASISTISTELAQLDDHETELRETITRTEEKRSWFADFREWLESVASFLDEKVQSCEGLLFPILILGP